LKKSKYYNENLSVLNGDWGLGIGDWGLGIGGLAQSPIPNPQSPIPNPQSPIPKMIIIYIILMQTTFLFYLK